MEPFTYDTSNAIRDCDLLTRSSRSFTATTLRLNHKPFMYRMTLQSKNEISVNGIVRVFLTPKRQANGSEFEEGQLYWNMIEMDKFPVKLEPGEVGWECTFSLSKKNIILICLDRHWKEQL